MFGLPDTRHVNRHTLNDQSSNSAASPPPPDSALTPYLATLRHQFDDTVEKPIVITESTIEQAGVKDDGEDDGLEFRLFRTDPKRTLAAPSLGDQRASVSRIKLRSPTPGTDEGGGFVLPYRPKSYYFAPGAGSPELRKKQDEYETVAMDGKDVILRSQTTAWPGTHLSFRVIELSSSSLAPCLKVPLTHVPPSQAKEKGRAGKKRRIALRVKSAAANERKEAYRKKKTEKNRKKKGRRREKEKERKRAVAGS